MFFFFLKDEKEANLSEKKQGWKCKGHEQHEGLEMLTGENATCNGCLALFEKHGLGIILRE